MKRILGILLATAGLSTASVALGDDKDATPILDKAITALGGEAKLAKAMTATWKGSGTMTFGDNESPIKTTTVVDGLVRQRGEIEMEFNGNPVKGVSILNGDKAWRKFGDNSQALEDEAVAGAKQAAYLVAVVTTVLPLKSKEFKVEAAPDEKVGGKPAAVLKGKGPDGKSFTLHFDKETGLPIKLTATVRGFQGMEFEQEATYSEYKDFDGIKRATKYESKRDGMPFVKMEYTDFKTIDKPAASAFAEPD
jgi:hypothetical protein